METTIIGNGGTKGAGTGFTFPFVVDKTSTFVQFRGAISDKYPWGIFDAVEFRYWDMQNTVWVPVQNDDELGVMFATNAESNSVQLEINVIQRKRGETESRVARSAPNPSQPRSNQTSRRKAAASRRKAAATSSQSQRCESRGRKSAAATSEPDSSQARRGNGTHSTVQQPGTPSANLPSQPCPEYSKATTDPIIEEEFPDEVPTDDEDERMHPEFVVRKPPNEDDGEDYIPPPQFEETDSDEREEDMDMGYSETEDEGRPDVQYNRDDPSLAEGTIFSDVIDCRNALATFSIKTQSEFIIDKSEPSRLTVHCAYKRCKWRMHASRMRNSTLFQVIHCRTNIVSVNNNFP